MDIFGVLTLIGGLALFLFGMNTMGNGLEKVSGGKLEKILEKLTSSPVKAVLLGAGVTAVIQSSSATTVMVVGFVNSEIMKLSQSISIIMGANIGTTVTSWILSLSGIESENLVIQLLKPTSLELGFVFNDLCVNFERIADHCSNIGLSVIQVQRSKFDAHEYIFRLKHEIDSEFRKQFDFYKRQYTLPQSL